MTGILEWTHDAQCALRPELGPVQGPPRWHDDGLHGIMFQTDKEYDFFAAIAGVRKRFGKAPLIPPRGVPENLSHFARVHFEAHGEEVAGWLHLSEIEQCIAHMSEGAFYTGFEVDIAIDFMRLLVARLTDPHVRLVFNIEGP